MALPLNVYTTRKSNTLSVTDTVIYTAPIGYNSIPLGIAACNTSTTTKTITIELSDPQNGRVFLVKDFPIPGNDTADLTVGKIVVPQNWSIIVTATDNTVNLTISFLENKI